MAEAERILLADDEERFTRTTASLLRDEGYECDCATDGASVLDMLRENVYDLLISDIKMPGNSELELVREVSRSCDGLPVILVTAHPDVETAIESVELAVVSYLRKPIEFGELVRHVEKALASSRVSRRIRLSRDRVRQVDEELTGLLRTARGPGSEGPALIRQYLMSTATSLVDAIGDVMHITEALEGDHPEHAAVFADSRNSVHRLTSALADAIQVLKETRGAFKSKQLAELRKRLERVIDSL